jgi:hypothetical protein
MLQKQAAKMARADSQSFRQNFHSAVLQTAFADQSQGARNRVRSSQPRRGSRRSLGPATKTRAITGLRGCGGRGEVTAILLFGGRRGAYRTAIHAAAPNADEKLAVEAGIARQPRSRTHLPIQIHVLHEPRVIDLRSRSRRFRTSFYGAGQVRFHQRSLI